MKKTNFKPMKRNWHCGIHRHGNCWDFRFTVMRYATCTFYRFWRFYISIEKKSVRQFV